MNFDNDSQITDQNKSKSSSSNFSERDFKINFSIITVIQGIIAFFLLEQMEGGFLRFIILISVAFVLVNFLVNRNDSNKKAENQDFFIGMFFGSITVMFFGFVIAIFLGLVLDFMLDCPKGKLISGSNSVTRTTPHTHRKLFECTPCNDSHILYDRVEDFSE